MLLFHNCLGSTIFTGNNKHGNCRNATLMKSATFYREHFYEMEMELKWDNTKKDCLWNAVLQLCHLTTSQLQIFDKKRDWNNRFEHKSNFVNIEIENGYSVCSMVSDVCSAQCGGVLPRPLKLLFFSFWLMTFRLEHAFKCSCIRLRLYRFWGRFCFVSFRFVWSECVHVYGLQWLHTCDQQMLLIEPIN